MGGGTGTGTVEFVTGGGTGTGIVEFVTGGGTGIDPGALGAGGGTGTHCPGFEKRTVESGKGGGSDSSSLPQY